MLSGKWSCGCVTNNKGVIISQCNTHAKMSPLNPKSLNSRST